MTNLQQHDRLARRDRILEAVARTTDRLSKEAPWREVLPDVLELLGEATGVSRVYYFHVVYRADGRPFGSQVAEWATAGVEPQIDNPDLQEIDLLGVGYGRWIELLESGEPVVGDIADFPESERPLLEVQDILSLLIQPVAAGSLLCGFIGFDACRNVQAWERVEVDVLRIAARNLGAAILRQEREARWRQTQQMAALGRMAGGVAHDFNNLLTVLMSTLDLTRLGLGGDETLRRAALESLNIADSAVNQASGLVRRLLDFSQGREGRPILVSVPELLDNMRPLLQQAIGRSIKVDIRRLSSVGPVRIDPVQFEQILMNLAINARDAMANDGRFEVTVQALDIAPGNRRLSDPPPGRWVSIRVRDDGEGMIPAVRDRVFEPFFTTKSVEQGTGLGLATVYSIVVAAGGQITVESMPGHGTTFRIDLPAASADIGSGIERPTSTARGSDVHPSI